MEDNLKIRKDAGWGCGLWCFSSSIGILDSKRINVKNENF